MLGLLIAFPLVLGWVAFENSGLFEDEEEAPASDAADLGTTGDDNIIGLEG